MWDACSVDGTDHSYLSLTQEVVGLPCDFTHCSPFVFISPSFYLNWWFGPVPS